MQNSGANPGKHNLVAGSLSLTILGLGVSSSFPLDPLTEELVILEGMTSKLSEVAIYSGKPSPVSFPPRWTLTSYPRRMPFMSCSTGSQLTFISEDEEPLAQTLAGATLGSRENKELAYVAKTPLHPTE